MSRPRGLCLPIVLAGVLGGLATLGVGAEPALARAVVAQPDAGGQTDEEAQRRREELIERRRRAQEQWEQQAEQRREEMAERERLAERDEASEGAETITLAAFSEPIELASLIELVAMTLEIEISIKGTVTGSVVFNSPQEMTEDRLLGFLEALLEQHGYAIYLDPEGFYVVTPVSELGVASFGEFGTTRIIPTPNVKPSGLQQTLEAQFGAQQRLPQAGVTALRLSFIDDLGVIVATGSPRRIRQVESMVAELLDRYSAQTFFVIELEHVAAPAARQRLVELIGRTAGGPRTPTRNPDNPALVTGDSLDNLAERLTADSTSNALIFRGLAQEAAEVEALMRVIDRPTSLVPRRYFAGSAASQIADIASQRGLGEVITLQQGLEQQGRQNLGARQLQAQQNQFATIGSQQSTVSGGSAMVVDVRAGTIIYYGTEAQQNQLATLIDELDTEAEVVVIREYRLQHADAEETAELLNNLVSSARPTGESSLIPGSAAAGAGADGQRFVDAQAVGDDLALADSESIFVIADIANNQLLVKAPKAQQDEFGRLIDKIDRRRAQVYIEATIVSVSKNEDFRFAVEQQLINAGGAGGLIQTNFGLTADQGDDITLPRVVNPSLSGLTSALILTDFIPVVINAIQTDTDARIISRPQILVDDNEEAELVSLEQQPTTAQSTGQTTDTTSFAGFEDAGTRLTVTPSISEGGYMRLNYEIELSNFVGQGSGGIPAPRQERTVRGDSVTIPDDTTIVVGGLTVEETRDTIVKVPLLGDIPLLGEAFRDTRKFSNDALLYIFITPKIMRDPNFADLRLLTRGPQATSGIDSYTPELRPSTIEILPGGGVIPAMQPAPATVPNSGPGSAPQRAPSTMPVEPAEAPARDPNADNPWIRPAPAADWPTGESPGELTPASTHRPGSVGGR